MNKSKQGKKNRASGSAWERRVRLDLEERGWIVDRWGNNVKFEDNILSADTFYINKEERENYYSQISDYETIKVNIPESDILPPEHPARPSNKYIHQIGSLVQAKARYNPFTKSLLMSKGGFPDFIIIQSTDSGMKKNKRNLYEVQGVECKINGYLDPEEREKCKWLLENKIFSKIIIAKKEKLGRKVLIKYIEFK